MDIITTRMKLKDVFPQIELSEEVEEDHIYIRKGYETKSQEVDEEEKTIVNYINTLAVDRDNEVILPRGGILTDYKNNNVVLWAHQYSILPIGKSLWIKKDKKGLISKTKYANHEEADKVYHYRKDGFPLAESIGFIPLIFVSTGKGWYPESDPEDWENALKEWIEEYRAAYGKKPKLEPDAIVTKWLLLEYSDVPVPSNPEALELAISKGLMTDRRKQIDADNVEEKAVIPYKDLGKEPEDHDWDAGKEVKEADIDDLKLMCTWYDKENADVKGSYKLPHHTAGNHKAVWHGVAAAMGALLGARGGVNIPDGDRKGVYNHLAKHYKQFDKDVPEFKEYEEDILELEPEKEITDNETPEIIENGFKKVIQKSKLDDFMSELTKKIDQKAQEMVDQKKGKVI